MGMRLLPTDWTVKCESVENQYRVWVLDYEQALHSTSCLPVHPSIRRKRGESNGCSFSVRWRVESVREGGGRRPVTVRDSKLYHKQVVLGHCPFLLPPLLFPHPSTTVLPLPSPSVTYLSTTVCDSFAFCQDHINPLPTERFYKNTDFVEPLCR